MNSLISNDRIINFANDLDEHSCKNEEFFDYWLLALLEKHFHFTNTGITAYNEGEYIGCLGRQRAVALTHEHTKFFHKIDILSKYISSTESEIIQTESPIICVTDLYAAGQYDSSDYFEFLRRAGLEYVAVMVLSNHRICLYKEIGEGNFDRKELNTLTTIYNVIKSKYELYKKLKHERLLSKNKSLGMEIANQGYLLFNSSGHILDHNQHALSLTTQLFKTNNIVKICSEILNLMSNEINWGANKIIKSYDNHVFKMKIHSQVDSFGRITTYYNTIIIKSQETDNKALPAAQENLDLEERFKDLTSRELEVLDTFSKGADYKEISEELFISENTIRSHIKNIYRKLDVNNQRALVHLYCQYTMKNS